MKTLHQLHNEEQAEAFRRDSVEFRCALERLVAQENRRATIELIVKIVLLVVAACSLVVLWFLFIHPHL